MAFFLAESNGHPVYLLWLLAWLIGAFVGSYLSDRKGYGDRWGLATGLLLSLAAVPIWLLVPSRPNSDWRIKGPIGSKRKDA